MNKGKALIVASVDVWSIISITEVSRTFRVNYQLTMMWQDPRLRFFNLKTESHLNMVAINESLTIWHPIAVFQNTLNRDKSKVSEQDPFAKREISCTCLFCSMIQNLQL